MGPGLATDAGSRKLNILLKRMRNVVYASCEYKIFRDTVVRAADETNPIQQADWRIWHSLFTRFNLFELAGLRQRAALVARFDSHGIRSTNCMARIPCGELSRIDWKCESPDMIFPSWQSARQDLSGFPVTKVVHVPPSKADFRPLIGTICCERMADTAIIRDYDGAGPPLGLLGLRPAISGEEI